MNVRLSIIVATKGRCCLNNTLKSITSQMVAGDELIVECDASGDWGATPRTQGMLQATGTHLLWIDDDDIYLPWAFETVRRIVSQHYDRPLMFQMRRGKPNFDVVWSEKRLDNCGNVSTQIFVVPNNKSKLGVWGVKYYGDYEFVTSTLAKYDPDSLVWVPEVIAEWNPERKNMKRAMFLSGHVRSVAATAAEIMKNHFDGDVFVATWDRHDFTANSSKIDVEKTFKAINPKAMRVFPYDTIVNDMKRKYTHFSKYRKCESEYKGRDGHDSFCMFYLMKQAWMLLKEHEEKTGEKYDVVVRFRPDYIFSGLPSSFIPERDTIYFPAGPGFIKPDGVTDNIFIADRETMDKMMLLPDLMDTYLLRESAPWHPEKLINYHMVSSKFKIAQIETLKYSTSDSMPPGSGSHYVDGQILHKELIFGTMVVQNDEDIIAECIKHNLKSGMDKIIVIDNGSTDSTQQIVKEFPEVVFLDILPNNGEEHSLMADVAMSMGAEWVVPISADELWDGIANLHRVPKSFNVVLANGLYEHKPTELIGEPFKCSQMPYFSLENPDLGKWGTGKFAFRPFKGVNISANRTCIENHVEGIGILNQLWLHRYPIRSYERYANKIGMSKVTCPSKHEKLINGTLREDYENGMIKITRDHA